MNAHVLVKFAVNFGLCRMPCSNSDLTVLLTRTYAILRRRRPQQQPMISDEELEVQLQLYLLHLASSGAIQLDGDKWRTVDQYDFRTFAMFGF